MNTNNNNERAKVQAAIDAGTHYRPPEPASPALQNELGHPDGTPAPQQRYKLLRSRDLAALPPLRYAVRNVLPAQGLAAIFGPSGSGKSFLGIDLLAAMAEGQDWFGYRVTATPVVYVCLEGEGGIRGRVQAWEAHHGRELPQALGIILSDFKLTSMDDVQDLAAVVPPGGVVVVDTLNRAAPLMDENSAADMGLVLERAKRLQAATGGLVLLIHHTGKDVSRGMRGHSSLFAALDAAIEVQRDGDRRTWRVAKSKDSTDDKTHAFRLALETVGTDEFGEPVTSCVVVPDVQLEAVRQVKLPQGGNQRVVLDALRPLFKDGVTGRPGAPAIRPCIELERAVTVAGGSLTVAPERKGERARAAITGLVARGVLGCFEGWLWLV